ncbi:MAG: hemerythrin domain-containing protein [Pseudomonadota bacterium]|nr:hemerythrin domain-containing protein [Pseudomonadota bacterium]MDP1903322.1 hemerythrin domain-containing protein [Pseudomonadota bacterium]MDP2352287.1 hemerythrin domain-containing protein [Pseudomonadota bacterium]
MTTLSSFLTNEHNQCDELYAEAENQAAAGDWTLADAAFQHFVESTQRHFAHEEEVVFPAFEAQTGMRGGPTQVMRDEHRQMNEVFVAMRDALARKDGNGYLGLSETLLMLMRQHNLKEENILYPMADQALAGQADALLAKF